MKHMRSLLFAPLLAGTVVLPLHGEWIAGMRGGYVDTASSAIDSSSYAWPTMTNSHLDAHAATNYASSGDIWGANRTWVYWGLIQLSGSVTFSLNIDDRAYLEIDGVQVIYDTSTTGTTSATKIFDSGWHTFLLRLYNSGGPAGPSGGTGVAGGMGFMMQIGAGEAFYPVDSGDATLFRYDDGLGFADTLIISGAPENYGTVVPAYGPTNELTPATASSARQPAPWPWPRARGHTAPDTSSTPT
jgi:hypothetical protein